MITTVYSHFHETRQFNSATDVILMQLQPYLWLQLAPVQETLQQQGSWLELTQSFYSHMMSCSLGFPGLWVDEHFCLLGYLRWSWDFLGRTFMKKNAKKKMKYNKIPWKEMDERRFLFLHFFFFLNPQLGKSNHRLTFWLDLKTHLFSVCLPSWNTIKQNNSTPKPAPFLDSQGA